MQGVQATGGRVQATEQAEAGRQHGAGREAQIGVPVGQVLEPSRRIAHVISRRRGTAVGVLEQRQQHADEQPHVVIEGQPGQGTLDARPPSRVSLVLPQLVQLLQHHLVGDDHPLGLPGTAGGELDNGVIAPAGCPLPERPSRSPPI